MGRMAQRSTRDQAVRQQVAPKTDLERLIADIWGEALQIEVVSTSDNFFELGGHSLLLTQVHNKLRHVLARNLAIVELFQYPTISTLAKHLSQVQDKKPSYEAMHDRAAKSREALNRQRQMRRNRGTGPRH